MVRTDGRRGRGFRGPRVCRSPRARRRQRRLHGRHRRGVRDRGPRAHPPRHDQHRPDQHGCPPRADPRVPAEHEGAAPPRRRAAARPLPGRRRAPLWSVLQRRESGMPSKGSGTSAEPGRVRAIPRIRRRAADRNVRTGTAGRRGLLSGRRVEGGPAERRPLERHVDGDGRRLRAGPAACRSPVLRDEQRVVAAGALRHADAGQHARVRARDRRHDDGSHRGWPSPVARAAAVRR